MFSKSIRVLLVMAAISFITHAATAQPISCKAGFAPFATTQAGIYVNFPAPWPAGTKYVVSVQQTNAGGYSPTSDCTYFNVLKLTDTNFQIQHKRCKDGSPVALITPVTTGWIACPVQ